MSFVLKWDIRQGEPLSPFLFLISAEEFLGLIRTKFQNKEWRAIAIGQQASMLSHLLFTDDSLLVMDASE